MWGAGSARSVWSVWSVGVKRYCKETAKKLLRGGGRWEHHPVKHRVVKHRLCEAPRVVKQRLCEAPRGEPRCVVAVGRLAGSVVTVVVGVWSSPWSPWSPCAVWSTTWSVWSVVVCWWAWAAQPWTSMGPYVMRNDI